MTKNKFKKSGTILFLGFQLFSVLGKDYPRPIAGYFSQKGQDKFLNENIFKNKRSGFFVDVGAHDGISFSNTYFFEKYLGWNGLCIEPNPDIYSKLIKNRSALCLQLGIANKKENLKFLKCSGYMLEMYSGIFDSMDEKHKQRIENEIRQFGGSKEVIDIECRTLRDIFNEYNIHHVDFMSIDIEGGEESAIEGIDFDKVNIDLIVIENNFNRETIGQYLSSQGYEYIKKLGRDDIFKLKKVNND